MDDSVEKKESIKVDFDDVKSLYVDPPVDPRRWHNFYRKLKNRLIQDAKRLSPDVIAFLATQLTGTLARKDIMESVWAYARAHQPWTWSDEFRRLFNQLKEQEQEEYSDESEEEYDFLQPEFLLRWRENQAPRNAEDTPVAWDVFVNLEGVSDKDFKFLYDQNLSLLWDKGEEVIYCVLNLLHGVSSAEVLKNISFIMSRLERFLTAEEIKHREKGYILLVAILSVFEPEERASILLKHFKVTVRLSYKDFILITGMIPQVQRESVIRHYMCLIDNPAGLDNAMVLVDSDTQARLKGVYHKNLAWFYLIKRIRQLDGVSESMKCKFLELTETIISEAQKAFVNPNQPIDLKIVAAFNKKLDSYESQLAQEDSSEPRKYDKISPPHSPFWEQSKHNSGEASVDNSNLSEPKMPSSPRLK